MSAWPRSALLAAVLLLAGCAQPGGGSGAPPPGEPDIAGDWEFVGGTVDGDPFPVPRRGRGTLSADGRTLSGTAFCNGFGGPYRLDGDRLVVGDLAQTLMLCVDEDRNAAETAYLRVLGAGGTRISRAGDELTLTNGSGVLRFRRQAPVPTAALVGTRWVLDSLVDGETASSPVTTPAGDPAFLALRDDGTFTGATGCRPLSGTWQSHGDTVTVTYEWPDATCPPGAEAQEQHVISALGNGFRVEIDGDRLTVTGRDGLGLAYRAAR